MTTAMTRSLGACGHQIDRAPQIPPPGVGVTFEPAVTLYRQGPPAWCLWRPVNQASARVLKGAVARAVRLGVLQPNGRAVYSGGYWFTWRPGGQLLYCTRQTIGRVPVNPRSLGAAMSAGMGQTSNGDGTYTCDDGTCVLAADPIQAATNCALGITTACPAPATPFVVSTSTDDQGNVITTWSDGHVTTTCAIDGSVVQGDPSNCPPGPGNLQPINPNPPSSGGGGGGGGGGGSGPLPPPVPSPTPAPSSSSTTTTTSSSSSSPGMIVAAVAAVVALGAGAYALVSHGARHAHHAHENPIHRRMKRRRRRSRS
jgi:hypothetical protein